MDRLGIMMLQWVRNNRDLLNLRLRASLITGRISVLFCCYHFY